MNYQLRQGDCLEIMPTLEAQSVDAIICDLPYGTTSCHWDSVIPFAPMWECIERVIKPRGAVVLFGSQPFTSALVMSNPKWFKYCWVWEKTKASDFINANFRPMKTHEDIAIFSQAAAAPGCSVPMQYNPQGIIDKCSVKTRMGTLGINRDRESQKGDYVSKGSNYPTSLLRFSNSTTSLHPTQKPVDLLAYLIETYTQPGETVLDFTMGSGSTGVACAETGRKFIGIEKDADYFAIAQDRIESAYRRAQGLSKLGKPTDTENLPLFA